MLYGCATRFENYQLLSQTEYDFIELSALMTVELSSEKFREMARQIKTGAIGCSGFNDFSDERLPLIGSEVNVSDLKEHIKKVCQRAEQLGAKKIGIGGPKSRILTNSFDSKRAKQQIVEHLYLMGEIAKEYQCTLLWEALSNCQFDSLIKEAEETVTLVDLKNVQLVADLYHMKKQQEPLTVLKTMPNKLGHIHLSGEYQGGRSFLTSTDAWLSYYEEAAEVIKEVDYEETISVETTIERPSLEALKENKRVLTKLFN